MLIVQVALNQMKRPKTCMCKNVSKKIITITLRNSFMKHKHFWNFTFRVLRGKDFHCSDFAVLCFSNDQKYFCFSFKYISTVLKLFQSKVNSTLLNHLQEYNYDSNLFLSEYIFNWCISESIFIGVKFFNFQTSSLSKIIYLGNKYIEVQSR